MISLSDGVTTLTLNPDLLWSDEFKWNPVAQTADRSITGAYIIDAGEEQDGRPITLEPEDDTSAWMARSTVDALRNWAAEAGKTLTLSIRGASRTVMFRHHDGVALEATPVIHFSDADGADYYRVTLRLMEADA